MEAAKSLRRRSSSRSFQYLIFSLAIVLFLMSNLPTVSAASKSDRIEAYKTYIRTVCNSAAYPKDCYKSLSPYASTIKTDPEKLYRVSLFLTIKATRKTSASIASLRKMKGLSVTEREIIRDCAETVSEALEELQQSLTVMTKLQGVDRESQMENIRTWVSAALTDEGTCTDGFDGQKVCNAVNKNIKKTVLNLSKMTSNCLSLLGALNY
ncbi:hypothetical protein DITRI_Ditri04bG0003100 [Diplodiscus trichospermus]